MITLPAWAVSAAILLEEDQPLSIDTLVQRVTNTALSGLGKKGLRPAATLAVQLRQGTTPDLFDFDADGRVKLRNRDAARRNAKVMKALAAMSDLQQPDSTLPEDLADIQRRNIDDTTKKALVNARLGQGRFRKAVLQRWDDCCAVTGSVTQRAIRASHIKPWRAATDAERLDPDNGIPLIANLDVLFDAGLISFDSRGTMVVSSELAAPERDILGLVEKALRREPTARAVEYLAYHHDHVFRK